MAQIAELIDALPLVNGTIDRGVKFANPQLNQRVYDIGGATPQIERFTGAGWVVDLYSTGPSTVQAAAYPGADGGQQVAAAIAAVAALGGGIVDARSMTGNQAVSSDMLAQLTAETPITLMFGPSVWTCNQAGAAVIANLFGSNIRIVGDNTRFVLSGWNTQSFMLNTDLSAGASGSVVVTNGSAVITIPALTRGVVPAAGKNIGIFGHIPNGGTDTTTLAVAITDLVSQSITLTNVGVPPGGLISDGTTQYIRIDNEIISFNVANCGTGATAVWTNGTRGALGSTAATHLINATVTRVTYDNYTIESVTGASPGPWTVTLDRPVTQAPSMTSTQAVIGPADVSLEGTLTFDGAMPPGETVADQSNNAVGLIYAFGTRLKVARTVNFVNWEHCAVETIQAAHCVVDGFYRNVGHPQVPVGFAVIFFQGSKYNTAYGDYENVNQAATADDRTVHSTYYDNLGEGNQLWPRTIRNCSRGVWLEGQAHGYAYAPYIDVWNWQAGGGNAAGIAQPQWVNAPGTLADHNTIRLGWVNPSTNGAFSLANVLQNSFISCDTVGVVGPGAFPSTQGVYAPVVMLNNTSIGIGIAAASVLHTCIYVNATIQASLGNASYGIVATANHPATSTSAVAAVYAQMITSAVAFTTVSGYGIIVKSGNVQAPSAVTTLYGLYVEAQTGGTTGNYGVFIAGGSPIALATGGTGYIRLSDQVVLACGNGGTPDTASGLMIGVGGGPSTALVNAIQRGIFVDFQANVNATSRVCGVEIRPRTAAAAFTAAFAASVYCVDASKGAGSTITTLYGVRVAALTQGGTNIGIGVDAQAALNFAIQTGTGLVRFGGVVQSTRTAAGAGSAFTPDLSLGNSFKFPANANPTVAAPTNAPAAGFTVQFAVTIQNTTAGAITTTWNAAFHLAGAWVDPAAGKQRTAWFEYDQAAAVAYEVARSAADVTT